MLVNPQYKVCFVSTLSAWKLRIPKLPKMYVQKYINVTGLLRLSSFSVDKIDTGQPYVKQDMTSSYSAFLKHRHFQSSPALSSAAETDADFSYVSAPRHKTHR